MDIQVRPDARALRTRHDAHVRLTAAPHPATVVTWSDSGRPGTRSLAGPRDCIRVVARTVGPRDVFAVVESALHRGVLRSGEFRELAREHPYLARAARASESGGESLLRWDLLSVGIEARQQVVIPGVGRVDHLIGERLISEVDGAEFHTERDDFEEDRRRDAVAASLGFRTLRFSYSQVERGDPAVMAAIYAALAHGDHR